MSYLKCCFFLFFFYKWVLLYTETNTYHCLQTKYAMQFVFVIHRLSTRYLLEFCQSYPSLTSVLFVRIVFVRVFFYTITYTIGTVFFRQKILSYAILVYILKVFIFSTPTIFKLEYERYEMTDTDNQWRYVSFFADIVPFSFYLIVTCNPVFLVI